MSGDVSNEQLYQELRKAHRRQLAMCALIIINIAAVGIFIHPAAGVVPAVFGIVVTIQAWHIQRGVLPPLLGRGFAPTEPDVEEQLGDPYEGGVE